MLAMATCEIPRGISCARMNGGTWRCSQPSRGSAESPDDGFARPSRDVEVDATVAPPPLSLLESAIWALYSMTEYRT